MYSWQTKQFLGIGDRIFHSSLLQENVPHQYAQLIESVGKRGKNIISLHIGSNIAGNQLK